MSKRFIGSVRAFALVLSVVATIATSGCYYHDYHGHNDYQGGHYGGHSRGCGCGRH